MVNDFFKYVITFNTLKLMHGEATLLCAVLFGDELCVTVLVLRKSNPINSIFAAIWAIDHFWSL